MKISLSSMNTMFRNRKAVVRPQVKHVPNSLHRFSDNGGQRGSVGRLLLALMAIGLFSVLLAGCSAMGLGDGNATDEPQAEMAVPANGDGGEAEDNAQRALASLTPEERNEYYETAPEMAIDPEAYYIATVETEKGDIKLQLFADRAPETVNNFVFLANQGFYDNTMFHRVLDGFMAQAGDPTGTGTGGPGYQFGDEIVPGLVFDRPGLLAMANAGPGTNGSQFFITFAPTDWLNGNHTIFGEVIEGSEVLNEITRRNPGEATPGDLIRSITITEADQSVLPTPTPLPPTPTPFAPSSVEMSDRPLAAIDPADRVGYFNTEPEMTIDPDGSYVATIATSQGDLRVELRADLAPTAVNNFVTLANLGFYDNVPVNQIVPDQLIIIGSPDNNPSSDVGYQFVAEVGLPVSATVGSLAFIPIQNAPTDPLKNSGSQLLISLIAPPADANAAFGFFGQTVEGVEILELLTAEDVIESITIEESE